MEAQLESLIEKLKTEGVESANQEAQLILEDAKLKAEKVLEEAEKKSEGIIQSSQQKAEEFQESSNAAVKQASRDMILMLKEKITNIFTSLLKAKIQDSLNADFIKELINKIVENIDQKGGIEVVLNDSDGEKLKDYLLKEFKDKINEEIEIKINNRITKGFRLRRKDNSAFLDLSEESIIEALQEFLNPAISKLLTES